MKIDTNSPRLPINRLKHPLKQKSSLLENEHPNSTEWNSDFAKTFESLILQDGAKRFEKWLEKLEIK